METLSRKLARGLLKNCLLILRRSEDDSSRMKHLHPWLVSCAVLVMSFPAVSRAADFPPTYNSETDTNTALPSPQESLSRLQLPEGFKATVFAAEPDVQNPIAMAWDARGRLWIAENYTYAERSQKFDLHLRDRIVIFADKDGDGRHDETDRDRAIEEAHPAAARHGDRLAQRLLHQRPEDEREDHRRDRHVELLERVADDAEEAEQPDIEHLAVRRVGADDAAGEDQREERRPRYAEEVDPERYQRQVEHEQDDVADDEAPDHAPGDVGVLLLLALVSYSPGDVPSWIPVHHADKPAKATQNFVGSLGAIMACLSYALFGTASYLLAAALMGHGAAQMLGRQMGFALRPLWTLGFVASGACLLHVLGWSLIDRGRMQLASEGGIVGQYVGGAV